MRRTLLLIDGEHYPPVIEAALPRLRRAGFYPVAALFLGGYEKTSRIPDLEIPVHAVEPSTHLRQLVEDVEAEVVYDLSDEPVVDARSRFEMAGLALAAGAEYVGGGIVLEAPVRPRLADIPTVAVIGTGKRTGKTALTIDLVRIWKSWAVRPCIVTMGRGGPPQPVVMRSAEFADPRTALRDLAERGLHATSDYVEDALLAGVDTVGTRRLGAGPTGSVVDDTFAAGVQAAAALEPDLLVYEGSGTAVPPAAADRTILVASTALEPEFLAGYGGPYRLAVADALVLVGPDEASGLVAAASRLRPDLTVYRATLTPEPTVPVSGREVVLATTAPDTHAAALRSALVSLGARSVTLVHTLSDRRRLAADLEAAAPSDLVLTEIKAAAADIVLPIAEAAGAQVGYIHNAVDVEGGLDTLAAAMIPAGVTAQTTV